MIMGGIGFSRIDSNGKEIETLCISTIPGRKHAALYVKRGTEAHVLAYFLGEKEAQEALEIIRSMIPTRRRRAMK